MQLIATDGVAWSVCTCLMVTFKRCCLGADSGGPKEVEGTVY